MKYLFLIIASFFLISACASTKTTDKNLTGEQISDNFIKAIGGKEKLQSVQSMKMDAAIQMQGVEFQIESYRITPNKMNLKMTTPQGAMTRILNGTTAVLVTPMGNQPITGDELDGLKEEAAIFPELYMRELGYKFEYIGLESIDDKETYKVKILMPNGKARFQFYDKESNLLVKMIDEKGRESYYGEYKAIDGIKFPHSSKLVEKQETINFIIKEIEINPEIDEKMFELK